MTYLTKKLTGTPGSFYQACAAYLTGLQDFASAQYLSVCQEISVCLNKILTYRPESAVAGSSRHNARREMDAYSATCLETVFQEIKKFMEKDANTFAECGDIWRQVLARAMAKGYDFSAAPAEMRIGEILKAIQSDQEFTPYYAHVVGLAGVYNARAILDTVLPQVGL